MGPQAVIWNHFVHLFVHRIYWKENNYYTVEQTAMPPEQAELPYQWLNDKMWQFLASVNVVIIFQLDLASVSFPIHQVTSGNIVALLGMFSN